MIESSTATRIPEDVARDPQIEPLADRPVGHDGTRVEVDERRAWAVSGFLVLTVALVLAGAQVLGAIVDLATGRIPLVTETRHIPQVISVFLIWFLAVPSGSRPDESSNPAGPRRLKVIDGERRAG